LSSSDYSEDHIYEEVFDINEKYQDIDQLVVTKNRDSLLKQADNHVIFIYLNGTPLDNGAKEYQTANLLPNYQDLTYERANVKTLGQRTLISLPIKLDDRTRVEA